MNDKLTADEIRSMEAGQAIDRLVAARIMGWSDFQRSGNDWHGLLPDGSRKYLLSYSTNGTDALQVMEKLALTHYVALSSYTTNSVIWDFMARKHGHTLPYMAHAPTPELAICRASLLAMMETDE